MLVQRSSSIALYKINRDRCGASICIGSNALYRRAALVKVGGTAEIGLSEEDFTQSRVV